MEEVRCKNCNQLLLKAEYCFVEIKCPRCKKTIIVKLKKDRVSNTTKNSE